MFTILIVEDDPAIAGAIERHMSAWGYTAVCASDFENITGEFTRVNPHLVLMDISLPCFNGYHWCGEIRKLSKAPVIFISSAADKMNIVMAVSMGGDDFVAKPFDLDVLTAKIQALLRRSYDFARGGDTLSHRGAVLDLGDMSLKFGGGRTDLTKNEFKILQVLMERPGRVAARELIMERLWETDSYIDDNTLTVNVTRLRRKLEALGLTGFIATKKGVGYMVD